MVKVRYQRHPSQFILVTFLFEPCAEDRGENSLHAFYFYLVIMLLFEPMYCLLLLLTCNRKFFTGGQKSG